MVGITGTYDPAFGNFPQRRQPAGMAGGFQSLLGQALGLGGAAANVAQVLQTPMAGARDPRTTLENPRVTSDSGRGAEASAKVTGGAETPKTGQTKMAGGAESMGAKGGRSATGGGGVRPPGGGAAAAAAGGGGEFLKQPVRSFLDKRAPQTVARFAGSSRPYLRATGALAGRYMPLIGGGLELAQGDIPGAVGVTAGGYIGGALGSIIAPGVGTAVGAGIGSMLGGSLADQASLNIFPDAELFGIPIGARAKERKQRAFEREEQKKDLAILADIRSDELRNNLAAQQSLLNSQGAMYQKIQRQAGLFQLAGSSLAATSNIGQAMFMNNPYSPN